MIRIRQIKIPIEKDNLNHLKKKASIILNCPETDIKTISISKKSLDARKKPNIFYIYEVDVDVKNEEHLLKKHQLNKDIFLTPEEKYIYPKIGNKKLKHRPIIIGSGPSGLFCAYLLAELGYKPIIIERGEMIEERVKSVEKFWETGILNKNSNVQFGEGGAGTFSDGKLNTLVKDKSFRMKKVFEIFVASGADKEILYTNNPHIGTDVLRKVIINLRKKIIAFGGEFHYNTTLTNINIKENQMTSIEINHKEIIETDILVLAIGHSARDTFEMLNKKDFSLEPKPFAVGLRIQHPQELININQYGKNTKLLPPASYKLTYQTKEGRGVYSFCMCPGGYVVNASSEEKRLAINGMSYHDRNSQNANSAIVVTISPKDYGTNPLDGLTFQRELEEKAYALGNGKIPIQTIKDFHNSVESKKLGNISPIFKGDYQLTNLNQIFPSYISTSIKEALSNFDKKIPGFNDDAALLAGVESRTSSPVKIPRGENLESHIKGIYPCGEGAGYAGGITTSAMDGLKVAESIISTYQNE
mgnify:FL=1